MRKTCVHIYIDGTQCKTQPIFNIEGDTRPLYCNLHKKEGMVNICEKRKCIIEGCIKKNPIYNIQGRTKGLYCIEHKTDVMVNVKSKKCIHEGCKLIPTYNKEGETNALYCSLHKEDGMVDIKHKRCIHKDEYGIQCKIRPTYNIEGETKALYCSLHKEDEMINVITPTCIHIDETGNRCTTLPAYNEKGMNKRLYCNEHKKKDMVNICSKTCIHECEDGGICNTIPIYNIKGENIGLYCNKHKLPGMVDVKNINKICIHEEKKGHRCTTRASYNIKGEVKGLYCTKHKLDGMVDVLNPICKSEWCYTRPVEKYDGYCTYCYMNLFPDKPVSRNYKTKERSVVEFLTKQFPDFTWVADKVISGGCSKRRPDLILDLGYQILVAEIDENQHTDYDCSCENKRIMELSQDVGHRPIVFIRFNPDDYIDENGNKISSCWAQDGNGLCLVKKSKKSEWESRLQQLNDQIQYWSDPTHRTNKTVEIVQLFYDMNLEED